MAIRSDSPPDAQASPTDASPSNNAARRIWFAIAAGIGATLIGGIIWVGGPANIGYLFHGWVVGIVVVLSLGVFLVGVGLMKGRLLTLVAAIAPFAVFRSLEPTSDIGVAFGNLAILLLVTGVSYVVALIAAVLPPKPRSPWQKAKLRRAAAMCGAALVIPGLLLAMSGSRRLLGPPPADHARDDLAGMSFGAEHLEDGRFVGANLDGAIFKLTDAEGADFRDASLVGADLEGIVCYECRFVDADLTRANLRRGGFWEADFAGARLVAADLTSARIGSAAFTGADLTDADLADAHLHSSDSDNFLGVTWGNTTCPDGTNSDRNAGNTCVGHLHERDAMWQLGPSSSAAGESRVPIAATSAGDCIDVVAGSSAVRVVDCAQPHDEQILSHITYTDDPAASYPGEGTLHRFAKAHCGNLAGSFLASAYEPPPLAFGASVPLEPAWDDGYRDVICVCRHGDGEPLEYDVFRTQRSE